MAMVRTGTGGIVPVTVADSSASDSDRGVVRIRRQLELLTDSDDNFSENGELRVTSASDSSSPGPDSTDEFVLLEQYGYDVVLSRHNIAGDPLLFDGPNIEGENLSGGNSSSGGTESRVDMSTADEPGNSQAISNSLVNETSDPSRASPCSGGGEEACSGEIMGANTGYQQMSTVKSIDNVVTANRTNTEWACPAKSRTTNSTSTEWACPVKSCTAEGERVCSAKYEPKDGGDNTSKLEYTRVGVYDRIGRGGGTQPIFGSSMYDDLNGAIVRLDEDKTEDNDGEVNDGLERDAEGDIALVNDGQVACLPSSLK